MKAPTKRDLNEVLESKPIKKFKKGMKLEDTWYYIEWGVGTVIKVLKTRVKIQFRDQIRTYDKSHYKFLKLAWT